MSSSDSYELRLLQGGRCLGEAVAPRSAPGTVAQAPELLDAGEPVSVELVRPEGLSVPARLRVGREPVLTLAPDRARAAEPLGALLRDEVGETEFVLEEAAADEAEGFRPVVTLEIVLRPRPHVARLFETLVRDLEAAHAGLAQDLVSRSRVRLRGRVGVLSAEHDIERMEGLRDRFTRALERIGGQPSAALERRMELRPWRPGDVVPSAGLARLASEPGTVLGPGGRVAALGRAWIARSRLTTDLAEHRHLREGLQRLDRRAAVLAAHCERMAGFYERERRRWSPTVFESRYRSRLDVLAALTRRADAAGADFRRLVQTYPFLRDAGPPRARLEPTPVWLNRPGYRAAYDALLEADVRGGPLVGGREEIQARFRSLATLYEYWCFVKVVELCRKRFGSPAPLHGFELVDDVYRPELRSGQRFRFPLGSGAWLIAAYEPDFPPVDARGGGAGLRAALSTGTLRPDITVEIEKPGAPPAILVLDAKSVEHFEREDLWKPTDYRSRIFDPATGGQPVRQVFFLHRDASAGLLVNLPGYLEGRYGDRGSSVIGAVSFLPDRTDAVDRVIGRFVATCA